MAGQMRLSEMAGKIAADLLASPATPAYLKDPAFAPAVHAYAHSRARATLLRAYADGLDPETAFGRLGCQDQAARAEAAQAMRAWDMLERAERMLAACIRQLGLDPLSRAKLGRSFAAAELADLAEAWKQDDAASGPEAPDADPDGSDGG